jgi:hypothetical protein
MFFSLNIKIAKHSLTRCNVSGSGTCPKPAFKAGFIFQFCFFKRSVIRFFSVLTRFFQLFAFLRLAFAEASRAVFSAAASPRFTASATSFSA